MTAPSAPEPVLSGIDSLVGSSAELVHRVTVQDAATNWGNDLPVLATPVLLWLSEIAAMKVVESAVPEGDMTVGLAHDSAHLAPTPVGDAVTVRATLTRADDRKLTFDVEARDSHGSVLRGHHTRALIDRARFTDKLSRRTA
ncbi:hotdog domain-containing protein [Streptomyces sp. NPDC008125]|uniref:thioesterase family protein n=1 Tax=Streptomyces sp. NPDC008125 TaxID=3364811 RepID=UPI0036E20700